MTRPMEILLLAFAGFLWLPFASGEETQSMMENLTAEIFNSDYEKSVAPMENGSPAIVKARIQIISLDVDEKLRQLKLIMKVYVQWVDNRLKLPLPNRNSSFVFTGELNERLWVPSLYFISEVGTDRSTIMTKKIVSEHNNNTLRFYKRYSTTITCPFKYYFYPMDTQLCDIRLSSFEDSDKEMKLEWHSKIPQLPSKKTPPQFFIDEKDDIIFDDRPCSTEVDDDDDRSCLLIQVYMKRLNGFHLLQMFIPSILIVIISWIGPWISVEIVPARVALGVTSLLTLVTQFSRAQDGLPPVSYVKAIDVWMLGCLLMVFATMIEFSIAYVLHHWKKGKQVNHTKALLVNAVVGNVTTTQHKPNESPPRQTTPTEEPPPMLSFDKYQQLDKASRYLFPLTFLFFIIIYWIKYSGNTKPDTHSSK